MLQYDFDQSVGCWVALTAHALRRAMAAQLAKEGITLRQWEVLAWISLEGNLSQSELAERLGIEAPTLVGILDRMERDGWLDRFACCEDRRRKRIRPTEKAEALWVRMVDCARRVRSQATEGFSPEELTLFKKMCERIRTNVDRLPPPGSAQEIEKDPTCLTEAAAEQETASKSRRTARTKPVTATRGS